MAAADGGWPQPGVDVVALAVAGRGAPLLAVRCAALEASGLLGAGARAVVDALSLGVVTDDGSGTGCRQAGTPSP